jgi:hypothetical protein
VRHHPIPATLAGRVNLVLKTKETQATARQALSAGGQWYSEDVRFTHKREAVWMVVMFAAPILLAYAVIVLGRTLR